MKHLKSWLWLIMGLVMFAPLVNIPWMLNTQLSLWMFIVDLAKPSPVLLIASVFYWPVLLGLTVWYWVWRFMRWIFEDEGPLPKFWRLLLLMWLPVTAIPTILLVCWFGWIICWYQAYAVLLEKEDVD